MNLPKWISDKKKSPFVEKISKTGQTLTKMPSVLNAKQRIASHRWQQKLIIGEIIIYYQINTSIKNAL